MKIGFMLPGTMAVAGAGNGVRVQAWRQADALEGLGHEVQRLNPWTFNEAAKLDVVQFIVGGFYTFKVEDYKPHPCRMLAFAPIIDSNQPNWAYRIAAQLGTTFPRLHTVNGEYRKQALACDLTIVRSRHERQRVIKGLGADPARVEIVLNGVNPPLDVDPDRARRELDLPDEFVLHVSAYTQERKNVVRLIEAVGPLGYPLVIAGTATPGAMLDRIKSLAQKFGNVRLLGFLDESMLNGLYAACKVFALPTDHEGTGLVALEAAALGANIVITRNGGPPDYFLNLAEYVDPFSVEDIRAAVQRAWKAPKSSALRDHVVNNLTWRQSAHALVNAYAKRVR